MNMDIKSGVKNGYLWIGIHSSEILGVKVALEPCPCVKSKSTATFDIRKYLKRAIIAAEVDNL